MAKAQDILSRMSPEMLARLKRLRDIPQERLDLLPEETRRKVGRVLALRNVALSMDEPEPVDLGMSPTGQALRGFLRAGGLPVDPSALETSPAPNRALSSIGGFVQPIASDIATTIEGTLAGAATGAAVTGGPGAPAGAMYGLLGGAAASSLNRQATERAVEAYRNRLEAEKMVRSRDARERTTGRLILEEEPSSLFGAGVARVSEAPLKTLGRVGLDVAVTSIGARAGGAILGGDAVEKAFEGGVKGLTQTARTQIGKDFEDVVAGAKGVLATPQARAQALRSAARASALGGGLNAAQYALTEKIEGRPIEMRQLLAEAALGGALDVGLGAGIEGLRLSRLARERIQPTPDTPPPPTEPDPTPEPPTITPEGMEVAREAALLPPDGSQVVTSEDLINPQEGDTQGATQEGTFQESGIGEYQGAGDVIQEDGENRIVKAEDGQAGSEAGGSNILPQDRPEESVTTFDDFLSTQGKDAERRTTDLLKTKGPGKTVQTVVEELARDGAIIIPGPPTKSGTPNKTLAQVQLPDGRTFNAKTNITTSGLAYLDFLIKKRDAKALGQAEPAATGIEQTPTTQAEPVAIDPNARMSEVRKKAAAGIEAQEELAKTNEAMSNMREFNPPSVPTLRDARNAPDDAETKNLSYKYVSGGIKESDILNNRRTKEIFDDISYTDQKPKLPENLNSSVSDTYRKAIKKIKSIDTFTVWRGVHYKGGLAISSEVSGKERGRVVAHELGHASHSLLGDKLNKNKKAVAELRNIEDFLYPGLRQAVLDAEKPDVEFFNYLLSPEELIAEFNVYRIAYPELVSSKAPEISRLLKSVEKDPNLVKDRKVFPTHPGVNTQAKERISQSNLLARNSTPRQKYITDNFSVAQNIDLLNYKYSGVPREGRELKPFQIPYSREEIVRSILSGSYGLSRRTTRAWIDSKNDPELKRLFEEAIAKDVSPETTTAPGVTPEVTPGVTSEVTPEVATNVEVPVPPAEVKTITSESTKTNPAKSTRKAAEKVVNEIERVVDTEGVKTAKAVFDRVVATLQGLVDESKASAGFQTVEFEKIRGNGGRILVDGQHVALVDRVGLVTPKSDYPFKASLPRSFNFRNLTPSEIKKDVEFGFAAAIARKANNGLKYVVQIPGDGTFRIEANPIAVAEILRRIKSAGPTLWKGVAAPVPGPTPAAPAAPATPEPAPEPAAAATGIAPSVEGVGVAGDQTPTTTIHEGLTIRPVKVRTSGGAVVERFAVQSLENRDRAAKGERQIGGDTLVSSLDEARREAERLVADEKRKDQRDAEASERTTKEAEAKYAKESPLDAYAEARGMSNLQRGKMKQVLQRQEARRESKSDKVYRGTRAEVLEQMFADGWRPSQREVPAAKLPSRRSMFRMDAAEQQAAEKRVQDAGMKTEYLLDKGDSDFVLTKAEHDYVVYLAEINEAPPTPEPAAAAPEPKEKAAGRMSSVDRLAAMSEVRTQTPDSYVVAKKSPNGKWKLMWVGTQNEVFRGETFTSAKEARDTFNAVRASLSSPAPEPAKPSKKRTKFAELPAASKAKLKAATSDDPVSETFFLGPFDERVESGSIPEADALGTKAPKQLFDGEKVSADDTRFKEKVAVQGATPINPQENHSPINSLSQFLVLLSQIAKKVSAKTDAFFPILRNPENLFDTTEGFQVLATTNFDDMETYLSNKLGELGGEKAAFVAAHEISHMMDPGRVFGNKRSLYERLTGDKIGDVPTQEQNEERARFQQQAVLLSEEFRGTMDAQLDPTNATPEEIASVESYSAKRREPGELFADVLAAVMVDPTKANGIAPELTQATLRMLNEWFPKVSASLTDFYTNFKTAEQRLAKSREMLAEGSGVGLRAEADVQKQMEGLRGGVVDQIVEKWISKSRSIITALRFTGQKITKELRDKVYTGISAITGTNFEQVEAARITEDMISSAEASGVSVKDLEQFLFSKAILGRPDDGKLSPLGFSEDEAKKILDGLKAKNEEWFDETSKQFNELMVLKNGIIKTAYKKGAFGPIGDRRAIAIKDRLLRDWIPMQKAEVSATRNLNPTIRDSEGFTVLPALSIASISESIGMMSKANKTWDLIQSLPDKGAGLFVAGESKGALTSPVTTWDASGEIRTNAYYTFKPIADLFDKPQAARGAEQLLGAGMKLSNKAITRFPWFVAKSLFRDTVDGTVFTFYLSDGIKGAAVYAKELYGSYKQLAGSAKKPDIDFGQGSAPWFLKKIVQDGPYKGLMDAISLLKADLDKREADLKTNPKDPNLLQARKFLQRNIGRAYALGAAFRGGSIMAPGQGYIDGGLASLSPEQITRRMQIRAGVDIDLTMGEKFQKSFGNNQAVKLFGNYMDSYSTVLQFVEFLPKVAAVLAKNDLMLSAGSEWRRRRIGAEGFFGAQKQIKKQIKAVEIFANEARDAQEKYDKANPGPAKVQAEQNLESAIDKLNASREDLNKMNEFVAQQERKLASAARNVGTPDIRLAGKSAPRIDNYLRFYSYNIEGMRRTFEQIGDAFVDGANGKTRVAMMMAPMLSLMVIRESILEMMGDDGKDWDQLVNPERYKYSIPLPLGVMRWVDDNGDERSAAYGVGIPVPDAMRMFNGVIEGVLNRGAVDRNLAGFIEDTVQSTASSVADFVGPSINPVLDIGGVMGALALGNNPNRGLSPFTSSKVMPRGTNVPDEERRAILAQYVLQRTGLSSWLPSVSGDKPDWFVPGGFRSTFFVDEGGITARAFKAGEAVAPQRSERIVAIMRGEYPPNITNEEVDAAIKMQQGARKAPAIRVLENMTAAAARNYGSKYKGSQESAFRESMKMGKAAREAFISAIMERDRE